MSLACVLHVLNKCSMHYRHVEYAINVFGHVSVRFMRVPIFFKYWFRRKPNVSLHALRRYKTCVICLIRAVACA